MENSEVAAGVVLSGERGIVRLMVSMMMSSFHPNFLASSTSRNAQFIYFLSAIVTNTDLHCVTSDSFFTATSVLSRFVSSVLPP